MRYEITEVDGRKKEEKDLVGGRHSRRIMGGRFKTNFEWMYYILSLNKMTEGSCRRELSEGEEGESLGVLWSY